MNPPTKSELAAARARMQWFLTTAPHHSMAESMRVMLRATAPLAQSDGVFVESSETQQSTLAPE